MIINDNAPTTLGMSARAKYKVQYKDSEIYLSKLQRDFFITLSNGKKYSSHQLMQQLMTSDPRREIKRLRDRGIEVLDVWINSTSILPRHKRYFINPKDVCNG